ncbi:MAG: polysaccharide lyase beta-sandwich domain-containing protein [Armatimonadota bacterium]|nr:polysaccharide lyase beta-sandwich domain-containing protein [Armatimonadota bacterium]
MWRQMLVLALGLLVSAAHLAVAADEAGSAKPASPGESAGFQTVIVHEREALLRGTPPDPAKIKAWMAALTPDGSWPDINYADQNPASWPTSQHLERVQALNQALVDPRSALHDDPALQAATLRALDYWTAHRFHNPNWWHNDIGVPTLMSAILTLLGDRVSGDRQTAALAVLNQFGRTKPGGGANTVWEAELGLSYAVLTGDAALAAQQSALISGEIKVSTGEGIQSDWSFHQHGARLQQFHYGGAFLTDTSRLGWVLHGTPWAISEEKLQILANCVLQGSQWMARGVRTVPGTEDRSISRPNSGTADLRGVARDLREALPSRAAELDALIARQSGEGASLTGFRAYPRSDFSAYQRPAFAFFVKTVSSRTFTTETGMNGENLKGQKLGCGDSYLLRDGQEYFNLQPVWDWDLLPGVTWAVGAGEVQRLPFVGAIGDGTVGATAMDYAFGTKADPAALTARKFWACDGDTAVCLIGDLRTSGVTAPVRTALDQCRLRGLVTVGDVNGAVKTLSADTEAAPLRWIHHAGVVYIPLGGQSVSLRLGPATGNWYAINHGYSKDPVTAPVFLPVLEQGASPNGQASGFVIAPAATPTQAAQLAAKPTWAVLRNDGDCQAVRFTNGDLMVAFYKMGRLEADGKPLLTVDRPCLVLQRGGMTRACDPTQKGGTVNLTRGAGAAVPVALPPGGLASEPVH